MTKDETFLHRDVMRPELFNSAKAIGERNLQNVVSNDNAHVNPLQLHNVPEISALRTYLDRNDIVLTAPELTEYVTDEHMDWLRSFCAELLLWIIKEQFPKDKGVFITLYFSDPKIPAFTVSKNQMVFFGRTCIDVGLCVSTALDPRLQFEHLHISKP